MNDTIHNITVDGRTHYIPEAWIVGATQSLGSWSAAVAHWIEQAQMEAAFQAQLAA